VKRAGRRTKDEGRKTRTDPPVPPVKGGEKRIFADLIVNSQRFSIRPLSGGIGGSRPAEKYNLSDPTWMKQEILYAGRRLVSDREYW
jgi:hypothetical protein